MKVKEIELWSDGSALKAPEGKFFCGSGCVLIYGNKEKHISHEVGYGTVNTAELTAPILGLQCLKEKCKVTIYTDSKYTMDSITTWWNGRVRNKWKTQGGEDVKNKDLIQQLHSLCQQHEVTWVKVKGHSGLKYNDLADELAIKASNSFKEKNL